MQHTTQHFNPHHRIATKRGFYLHVVDPPGGPIGENSMAKNLGFTMEGLGFEDSVSWSMQTINPPDTNVAHYPRLMYYYHPDYLGHVEYITDLDGVPYQYFYYTPWGEALVEQKNTLPGMHYNSPYRFNGKELDEETGLYYYGARYYNPTVSVWLGVDPLDHLSPERTPYHFVRNNPIFYVDPNGLTEFENAATGEKVKIADGMNQTLKIEDSKWNNLTDLTKSVDGNSPSDEYNAFIVQNGEVGVPTEDCGGYIENEDLFIGFMAFKAANEKREVAAWEMQGANGENSFIVQPWVGNEEGASFNYQSIIKNFGFSSRSDIIGQYHTHPGSPPDIKRGLSREDMRASLDWGGIPVRSIYSDGKMYEGKFEPRQGLINLIPLIEYGAYGKRIR